jgi:hypothetical protein
MDIYFYILGKTLRMKHNNLVTLGVLFQLLMIESEIHFRFFSFEISLDVGKIIH